MMTMIPNLTATSENNFKKVHREIKKGGQNLDLS